MDTVIKDLRERMEGEFREWELTMHRLERRRSERAFGPLISGGSRPQQLGVVERTSPVPHLGY